MSRATSHRCIEQLSLLLLLGDPSEQRVELLETGDKWSVRARLAQSLFKLDTNTENSG